ncbi:MAG TPA: CDP-diacylglycerol--serine O-phosphatidyltransferase [Bdellovibrionales bacterium]|nr:CDP-diacylglycerol--serine O-phosphatidyltransferase [Pseudobdellovibrionaceae bacterium]HAG92271.1 CDP-diacylglycerol--serine O-phosphatidyltransferase [Bdellovibrionales bacterium]|tara:strand:+ start:1699 stop:2493 length:795 start_codon:yes stop_codon:yes gene_type:complete
MSYEEPPSERRNLSIYVLPNLLTTLNMFFGFFAIIYTINGKVEWAAYAIVAAALFDQMDGRVARWMNSTSRFGAEYDSLSDLVSFGVAPAVLLFLWSLEPFGRLGWLATFFYMACGALRLARFNVQEETAEKGYFQGLPIPMAAGIVASSVLAFQDLEMDPVRSIGLLGMTFLLGVVMVSNFRYRSFKDMDLKERLPFTYLVVGVFLVAIVAIRPEVTLFILFLSYALLGAIFGVFKLGRNIRKNRRGYQQFETEGEDENEITH